MIPPFCSRENNPGTPWIRCWVSFTAVRDVAKRKNVFCGDSYTLQPHWSPLIVLTNRSQLLSLHTSLLITRVTKSLKIRWDRPCVTHGRDNCREMKDSTSEDQAHVNGWHYTGCCGNNVSWRGLLWNTLWQKSAVCFCAQCIECNMRGIFDLLRGSCVFNKDSFLAVNMRWIKNPNLFEGQANFLPYCLHHQT